MRRYIREAKISYIQLEQETQLQDHTSILWQPPLLAQPGPASLNKKWSGVDGWVMSDTGVSINS